MADKKLAGAKVLMVIAPDQFRDEELLTPQKLFIEEGAEVVVACCQPGEAKGMLGARIQPDVLVKEINPAQFDAITVVGGMGSPDYLWNDLDLHKILQAMHKNNKVVSAICLSGAALAQAGVLKGKQATVWPMPESIKALADGQAIYKEQHLVVDGKTITADGPEAAADFAMAIVKELARTTVSSQ